MKMDKTELKEYIADHLRISVRINEGCVKIKLYLQDDHYPRTIDEDYFCISDIKQEM